MASNSINKHPNCEICGKKRPTTKVQHPFKDEKTIVAVPCECEIKADKEFYQMQKNKERKRKIEKVLKMSSDLESIKHLTFKGFKKYKENEAMLKEISNAVKNFDNNNGLGMLIFGVTGNGKTHATAAGGNLLLKAGYSVIFLTEKDLLSRLKATNNFNNPELFSDIMQAALNADLLIWDDFLSSNKLSNDEKDWIFQIINGRERRNKPIWFTSNITPKEFESDEIQYILDDKARTWWRILNNTTAIFNSAPNERKKKVIERVKGLD